MLTVAVAGVFMFAVLATAAHADASACDTVSIYDYGESCINVIGIGLHVSSINASVWVYPNGTDVTITQISSINFKDFWL
jgi:hypothetical protein